MIALSEFQAYLKALCQRYEQWWSVDALTETIAAQQATFSFEQMVETEEKHSEESLQRVRLPIFKGIQDYIESEHILLVGSPGVGKSTTLLRCLVQFAEREQVKPAPRIPVLIELRRYNSDSFSCPEDPSGILTLIKDTLEPDLWLEVSEIKKLLFQDRRLILLLDGLNEMSAGEKRTELEAFRKKCDRCKVPLICTTRKLDGGDLGIKRKLEIQSLNPTEIDRFLQECTPEQRQKISQLLNRDNRELSRTPFVLWMLYHSSHEQGTEVETLGEAFRQFFRSFKKHKEDAPVSEERRKDWHRWLEYLAFTMLDSPEPTDPGLIISKEQAESILVGKFGDHYGTASRIEELLKYHLLESISEKEISFHHHLIQEYYAAEYLLTQLPELLKEKSDQNYIPFQAKYLNYLKWTEAIALMLGLPEVTTNQAKQLVELALSIDLMLGARLAGEVKTENQEKVVNLVENLETTALVKISLLEKTRSSLAANGLRNALKHSEENIRRRGAWALRKMPHNVVVALSEIALKDVNSKVRENVTWALGESKIEYVIPILDTVLERDSSADVRLKAMYALQEFGASEEAIIGLLKATRDSDRNVKSMSAYALGKLDRQIVISILARALNSEDITLKVAAIKMLERLGTETVTPYLRRAILDLNQTVHLEATHSLKSVTSRIASQVQRKIESARIDQDAQRQRECEACIADLKANNPIQKGNAVQRLVGLIGRDSISIVITALDDPDGYVQFSACNILASRIIRQFPEEAETLRKAVPKLIEILNEDEESRPHAEAASVLGQLKDKTACDCLSKAMSYEEPSTRRNVIEALVKLGCKEVEVELIKALKDADSLVQSSAIKALGEIQCEESISELIGLLKNADIFVQSSICEALGQFQGDVASKHLPRLIELAATDVGEQALCAIAAIQSRCGFYNYEINQLSKSTLLTRETAPEALLSAINQITHATYEKVIQMEDQPKVQMNFHAPVENAIGNVEGDMVINATPLQDKEATTAISNLLNNLHQKYPNATDEEIYGMLLRGFQAMPQKNPQNWQRWQDVLSVFFSGGIEATKVFVPIAGIPIEVIKRLYEVYDRNRKKLSGS